MPEIYRVDRFSVPDEVRAEFWTNVRKTHDVLREQHGFIDDTLLERQSGKGVCTAVTIVRWADAADLPTARHAVEEAHRAAGYSPAAFFARVGIEADLANYVAVPG